MHGRVFSGKLHRRGQRFNEGDRIAWQLPQAFQLTFHELQQHELVVYVHRPAGIFRFGHHDPPTRYQFHGVFCWESQPQDKTQTQDVVEFRFPVAGTRQGIPQLGSAEVQDVQEVLLGSPP
jgi:hypothetical protein